MSECYVVTGGGGFIGKAIVKLLIERRPGCSIRVVARNHYADLEKLPGVTSIQCDLSGPLESIEAAFEGAHAVFHVAAKAGIWGAEESFFRANVLASRQVVLAARSQNVAHIVYTSTPSVVFNGEPYTGENETLPYGKNWLGPYAKTKAMAEKETLASHVDSLRVCALRPHLVWGPEDNHILPKLIRKAHAGRLVQVGNGENRVDISYIDNVAHAHLLALEALENGRAGGEAFFLSDAEPVKLWSWINSLLERVAIEPIKKKIPLRAAYFLGSICEKLWSLFGRQDDPPMTRFVAVELAKDHYFSIEKAQRILGYQPVVEAEVALKRTAEWIRSDLLS